MWDIPARFIQLTDDWQFERDKIGVDKVGQYFIAKAKEKGWHVEVQKQDKLQ